MRKILSISRTWLAGIALMLGFSVIMLPVTTLIIAIILIPLLLLFTFLGINITGGLISNVFSTTGLFILSFLLALGYTVYGDKLVKKKER